MIKKIYSLLAFILLISPSGLKAQDYAATFESVPNSSVPPSQAQGPDLTSEGVVRFYNNDFSTVTDGDLTVSAEFTNTLYTSDFTNTAARNGANDPDLGMNFGSSTISNQPNKIYDHENRLEGIKNFYAVENSYYDPGTGGILDHPNIQGFNMLVVTEGLNTDALSTNGTYEFGELKFTFNRPVDYPVIHFSGLGGFWIGTAVPSTYSNVIQYLISYTADLESKDYDLTKLSGTPATELSADNRTITNTWSYTPVSTYNGTGGDEAGTGSFRVEGTNITEVVFKVYMRGKPELQTGTQDPVESQERWSSYDGSNIGTDGPDFTNSQSYAGEQFHAAMSLPIYDFSGSVVVDGRRNGTTQAEDSSDGSVTGEPYTSSSPDYEAVFAVLVNNEGKVVAVDPVDQSTGQFDFENVIGNDYKVVLSTSSPAVGSTAPTAATLPTKYQSTEEEFVDGGADDTPDSVTNLYNVNYSTINGVNTTNLIIGIAPEDLVLPIELASFTAEAEGLDAMLNWETLSELDNKHFIVERSIDGVEFEEILRPIASKAPEGTSEGSLTYSIVDKGVAEWLAVNSESTVVYYRLKQVDLDGTVHYPSATRPVDFNEAEIPSKLFPNPVSVGQRTTVQMEGITKVEVYTLDGQLVKVIEESTPVKGTSISTNDLSKGAYMVVINDGKAMKLIVK